MSDDARLVPICPDCLSRKCPSLSDTAALCPQRALRGLTEHFLQLAETPEGRRTIAGELAKCVIRLDAIEKHIAATGK